MQQLSCQLTQEAGLAESPHELRLRFWDVFRSVVWQFPRYPLKSAYGIRQTHCEICSKSTYTNPLHSERRRQAGKLQNLASASRPSLHCPSTAKDCTAAFSTFSAAAAAPCLARASSLSHSWSLPLEPTTLTEQLPEPGSTDVTIQKRCKSRELPTSLSMYAYIHIHI